MPVTGGGKATTTTTFGLLPGTDVTSPGDIERSSVGECSLRNVRLSVVFDPVERGTGSIAPEQLGATAVIRRILVLVTTFSQCSTCQSRRKSALLTTESSASSKKPSSRHRATVMPSSIVIAAAM